MRPTASIERLEVALLEVVGFAVTSARNLLDETASYGPLRLLEAAIRTIDAMQTAGVGPARIVELRMKIDSARASLFEGEDALRAHLDALVGDVLQII
jgi:hypothetical protein